MDSAQSQHHLPARFDHLMFGGALTLDALSEAIEGRCGVRAALGGRHDTGGTHNALLGLGGARYLELIASDPEGDPEAIRGRLIAMLPEPRSIAWAIAVEDLDQAVERALAKGYDPGPIHPLRRQRPDGIWLSWRLCWEGEGIFLGVVPFLIEWGTCPHPTTTAPAGCHLLGLRAEHPRPEEVAPILEALDVEMAVEQAREAALIASVETPAGVVELR